MTYLEAYNWPGNVRELENVMERLSLTCTGPACSCDNLPREFTTPTDQRGGANMAMEPPPEARML